MLNKYKTNIFKYSCYSIVAILFMFLLLNTDFNEMYTHLTKISISTLVCLVVLQFCTQGMLCLQWYRLVDCFTGIKSMYKVFYILCSGTVIEAITPGAKIGGELTRYHFLKKEMNVEKKDAVKIILVQKCISMSVLFTISIVSFLYVFLTISISMSLAMKVLSVVLSLLIVLFLFILLFYSSFLVVMLSYFNLQSTKIYQMVVSYNESIALISTKEWIIQYMISLFVWIVFPFKMFLLARSLGLSDPFIVLLAITMTAYAIGTLPITPGGIGTFEATLISLFQIIHVHTSLAITLTIVFRFVTFWLVCIVSTLFTICYQRIERVK